ncbi:hypothetical protein G6F56_004874 [Rhizopus delemar]|nr:hypothetical protein G6F56_004874 [Rhizopus delemar]
MNASVTENDLSSIFELAGTCLNHSEQISVQYKKRTPPPLPRKPRSLSTSLAHPPPLPPRKHLDAKLIAEKRSKKGDIKASTEATLKIKHIKPTMGVRRSSSPQIASKLISTYNKDLFLSATTQVQTRTRAKTLPEAPLDGAPWIPQPPLDFIAQKLKQQQKFDPSFEKLRMLQAIQVLSILQFCPAITAYQLTLIESAIFRHITLKAIKHHKPKTPEPSILASVDFFNYLTRLIEYGTLTKPNASDRARHLNYWIQVAHRCHELKNYQTLKAIISALGTPPMQRLKQSWSFVPKKSMQQLEELTEIMSESSNYEKYRLLLLTKKSEPVVPFLGLFLHDMTYLCALKDPQDRETELVTLFDEMQSAPAYSAALPLLLTKEIYSYNRPKFSIRTAKKIVQEDHTKMGVDLQQCLVAQYLLTRPWVSEKMVDELCLLREPHKPNLASSTSLTTTRSSAGSLTSNSTHSRPLSLEDDIEDEKRPVYWLFGRKSVDHHTALKSFDATLHRSPRHFSFDELKEEEEEKKTSNSLSIFRKDFWKSNNNKLTMTSFISDPSLSRNADFSHPLDNGSFIWDDNKSS